MPDLIDGHARLVARSIPQRAYPGVVATPYNSTLVRDAEAACGAIRYNADRIDEVADGLGAIPFN